MYDRDLVKEILSQILKALDTVIHRFAPVKSLADLTDLKLTPKLFSKFVKTKLNRYVILSTEFLIVFEKTHLLYPSSLS